MPHKQQKQYRYKNYDYSQNGYYFITICTKNKQLFFGEVKDTQMQLSEIGESTKKCLLEISNNFEKVRLDEWVVMPNHIHIIIMIDNCRNTPRRVLNGNINTPDQNTPQSVQTLQPLIKGSVSSIINHFKGNVKRYCNKNDLQHFAWQSRFHDRIIRNEKELNNARQYIVNNPIRWTLDRNNSNDLYI